MSSKNFDLRFIGGNGTCGMSDVQIGRGQLYIPETGLMERCVDRALTAQNLEALAVNDAVACDIFDAALASGILLRLEPLEQSLARMHMRGASLKVEKFVELARVQVMGDKVAKWIAALSSMPNSANSCYVDLPVVPKNHKWTMQTWAGLARSINSRSERCTATGEQLPIRRLWTLDGAQLKQLHGITAGNLTQRDFVRNCVSESVRNLLFRKAASCGVRLEFISVAYAMARDARTSARQPSFKGLKHLARTMQEVDSASVHNARLWLDYKLNRMPIDRDRNNRLVSKEDKRWLLSSGNVHRRPSLEEVLQQQPQIMAAIPPAAKAESRPAIFDRKPPRPRAVDYDRPRGTTFGEQFRELRELRVG